MNTNRGLRGVGLASRVAYYYPQRFYGFVSIAVAYNAPGPKFDLGMRPIYYPYDY